MVLAFGEFELDLAACELRRDGQAVRLQPRVFELLRYLVEHRDRVVSQRELIDALWDGQQLNSVAVPWSISHARRALGERGPKRRFIETIRGRGYRFVAQVEHSSLAGEDVQGASTPKPRPAAGSPSFVGRADIMRQLSAALDAARAGRGGLYLLTGEPGIGKTRCAEELSALARASNTVVLVGRAVSAGGAPAFWPWIQVLRSCASERVLAQRVRDDAAALLQRLTPEVASSPGAGFAPPAELSSSARFWLLDSLSTILRRAADRQPCLVVLDDLQDADEGSLQALSLLAPQLERTHMLVLATARVLPGAPAGDRSQLALRLRPCETIALSGLQQDDIARWLEQLLGEAAPAELTRAVHGRTAGNPLYLKEVLRLLATQRERGEPLRVGAIEVPDAARSLLSDRIAALDRDTRRVLDAACVMGEELDLSVLQRVVELSPDALLARLDAALDAQIIESRGPGRALRFAHQLLREALYEALPVRERVRLHARIGFALESMSVVEPRYSELAYHFHHALPEDHYERVVRYARLAGQAAARVFAYDEAAKFYAWAIAAQPYVPDADARSSCELLLSSAGALLAAGRRGEWRAQCKQAMALARGEDLPDLLVDAARLLRPTVFFARMPDPVAANALQEALERLPKSAKAARAKALSRLACLPPHANSLAQSRRLSAEALQLARELGSRSLLLDALKARLYALSGADTVEPLLATADEILSLQGEPASWLGAEASLARYRALLERGDGEAALEALEAFGAAARRLQLPRAVWHYDRLRAQQCLGRGELDRAERWFQELWQESQRLGLRDAAFYAMAQSRALAFERTGRRQLGEKPAPSPAWLQAIPSYRAERLLMLIDAGDETRARDELEALAQNDLAAVLDDQPFLFTLVRLAQSAVALRAREHAAQLYARLQPYASFNAVNAFFLCAGSVAHVLGLLAQLLDRPAEAETHFELALSENRRLGYAPRVAHSQLALAELLWQRRTERPRARALAQQAAAGARRLGLSAVAAQSARLLKRK